jgi:prepilin peptidase CpaA
MEQSLFTELLLLTLILLILATTMVDLLQHRIPNLLCICVLGLGITMQSYSAGWEGAITAASGSITGLLLFLPLYIFKGMGAGDVKLLASLGALFGPFNTLIAAAFALVIGGCLAMVYLLMRLFLFLDWGKAVHVLKSFLTSIRLLAYTRQYFPPEHDISELTSMRFPYALAIAGGALIVMAQQSLLSFIHLKALLINELGINIGGAL